MWTYHHCTEESENSVKVTRSRSHGLWQSWDLSPESLILGLRVTLGGVLPPCLGGPMVSSVLPGIGALPVLPQLGRPPFLSAPFRLASAGGTLSPLRLIENLLSRSPFLVTLFGSNTFVGNTPACIEGVSNFSSFGDYCVRFG